jgi:hypothetical protein
MGDSSVLAGVLKEKADFVASSSFFSFDVPNWNGVEASKS